MATKRVTQDEVNEACNQITQAGEQPTTIRVRENIGRGSFNTIQKMMKIWRESDEAREQAVDSLPVLVELPAEFQDESLLFVKKIYKLAEKLHYAKIEQINQSAEQRIATANDETQKALDYTDAVNKENEQIKLELGDLHDKVRALEEEKKETVKQLLDDFQKQRDEYQVRLTKSEQKQEALQKELTKLLKLSPKALQQAQLDEYREKAKDGQQELIVAKK